MSKLMGIAGIDKNNIARPFKVDETGILETKSARNNSVLSFMTEASTNWRNYGITTTSGSSFVLNNALDVTAYDKKKILIVNQSDARFQTILLYKSIIKDGALLHQEEVEVPESVYPGITRWLENELEGFYTHISFRARLNVERTTGEVKVIFIGTKEVQTTQSAPTPINDSYTQEVVVENEATATSAEFTFNVKFLGLMINDSSTNTIQFSFDNVNWKTLLPSEHVSDLKISASKIHVRTTNGTAMFRAWGWR